MIRLYVLNIVSVVCIFVGFDFAVLWLGSVGIKTGTCRVKHQTSQVHQAASNWMYRCCTSYCSTGCAQVVVGPAALQQMLPAVLLKGNGINVQKM